MVLVVFILEFILLNSIMNSTEKETKNFLWKSFNSHISKMFFFLIFVIIIANDVRLKIFFPIFNYNLYLFRTTVCNSILKGKLFILLNWLNMVSYIICLWIYFRGLNWWWKTLLISYFLCTLFLLGQLNLSAI